MLKLRVGDLVVRVRVSLVEDLLCQELRIPKRGRGQLSACTDSTETVKELLKLETYDFPSVVELRT